MGYRSEVGIGIHKKAKELAIAEDNWPEMFSENEPSKETDDYVLYVFDGIKWYPTYEQVDEVTEFLNFLEHQVGLEIEEYDSLYGFMRIGEEAGDLEQEGDPYAYGIGYSQSIYFYED